MKLGFGLMRLPVLDGDYAKIDLETFKQMVDYYIANGGTYFDTAWVYHKGNSELAFKEAVVKRYPREKFLVATKMPMFEVKEGSDLPKIFDKQLEKTGAGYFDYYLLHALDREAYELAEKTHAFEFIVEKKRIGLIKRIGFSFHDDADTLDNILNHHPEVEFVQLQINYIDYESPSVQSKKCYDVAVKHGCDVIVMEPVKGGSLAVIPEKGEEVFKRIHPELSVASWAVRFVASMPKVIRVLSGMSNMEQLIDNVSYMKDFKELTAEEYQAIDSVVEIIKSNIAIDCTKCKYCITEQHCPKNISIPDIFALYNNVKNFSMSGWEAGDAYQKLTEKTGKASACIKCGKCESHCPQHLPIRDNLVKASKQFER